MKKFLLIIIAIGAIIAGYYFGIKNPDFLTFAKPYIVSGDDSDPGWGKAIGASPLCQGYFSSRAKGKDKRKPYLKFDISRTTTGSSNKVMVSNYDVVVYEFSGKSVKIGNEIFKRHLRMRADEKPVRAMQKKLIAEIGETLWISLIKADPKNIKLLIPLLKTSSGENAVAILRVLEKTNPEIAQQTLAAVQKKLSATTESQVKLQALRTMAAITPKDGSKREQFDKEVIKASGSKDKTLRNFAVSQADSSRHESIPDLLNTLKSANSSIEQKIGALEVLRKFGPKAKAVLPLLSKFVKSDNSDMRKTALLACGDIGVKAPGIIRFLRKQAIKHTRNKSVKDAAATSYLILGSPWLTKTSRDKTIYDSNGSHKKKLAGDILSVYFCRKGVVKINARQVGNWNIRDMTLNVSPGKLSGALGTLDKIYISHTEKNVKTMRVQSNIKHMGKNISYTYESGWGITTSWTIMPKR